VVGVGWDRVMVLGTVTFDCQTLYSLKRNQARLSELQADCPFKFWIHSLKQGVARLSDMDTWLLIWSFPRGGR